MSEQILLVAQLRDSSGTGNSRELRRNKQIPAIVYGGKTPVGIALDEKETLKYYSKGMLNSAIVEIELNNKSKMRAIVREIQLDPLSDLPIHIDFQEIFSGVPVKINVRVKTINAEICPGLKKGGVLNLAVKNIPCMCDPDKLIRKLEIDLKELEIGGALHAHEINMPESLHPINKNNFTILRISGRAEEETASKAPAAGGK
jgi:large subunit ribosomal protein L25